MPNYVRPLTTSLTLTLATRGRRTQLEWQILRKTNDGPMIRLHTDIIGLPMKVSGEPFQELVTAFLEELATVVEFQHWEQSGLFDEGLPRPFTT